MFVILSAFLYLIIQSSSGKVDANCAWGDFSLAGAQGYEVQCIDGGYSYGYTPCMRYALCNNVRYQAVYFDRNIGQCEYYLADWDDGATIPQYSSGDGMTNWTFNYENGQITTECSTGIQFEIVWKCDPDSVPFSLDTECAQINQCKHKMEIKSAYACTEAPPDDDCVWGPFNLEGVRGYELQCIDGDFAYAYTPCFSYALCDGVRYQATYFNRNIGQCQYYLSQWDNGQTAPNYFNNGGIPLWQFNCNNGQQTSECPSGIEFEINWNCDEECTPFCLDSQCNQVNECRHQLSVRSAYACSTPDTLLQNEKNITKLMNVQQKLQLHQNK